MHLRLDGSTSQDGGSPWPRRARLGSWSAFLWPLVIGQQPSSWMAQVIDLPALFIGALLTILPPLVRFAVLQRSIVEGIKLTEVKG